VIADIAIIVCGTLEACILFTFFISGMKSLKRIAVALEQLTAEGHLRQTMKDGRAKRDVTSWEEEE
jgi:hypothetical protein